MKSISLVVLAALCISFTADAMTLKEFVEMETKGQQYSAGNDIYLSGIIDGLKALDGALRIAHQPRFYCEPKEFSLQVEKAKDIIVRTASEQKDADNVSIAVILVVGLRDAFPCEGK